MQNNTELNFWQNLIIAITAVVILMLLLDKVLFVWAASTFSLATVPVIGFWKSWALYIVCNILFKSRNS
jgi:hypothetical protein